MKRFKLLGVIIGIFAVVLIACFPMIAEDMDKSKIGVNQIPITGTYEYWTDGGGNNAMDAVGLRMVMDIADKLNNSKK